MAILVLLAALCSANPTPMVDDKQAKSLIKSNSTVIALIVDESDEDFWQEAEVFSHVVESGADASFVVITSENAPKNFEKWYIMKACVAFFINGTAMFAVQMPESPEALIHVVQTAINNDTISATDLDDFHEFYDQFEFTIIATPETEESARVLYIRHTYSRGPLGFCVMNASFFDENGMNASNFGIYRSYEGIFTDCDGSDIAMQEAMDKFVNYDINEDYTQQADKLFVVSIGQFEEEIDFIGAAKINHKPLYGMFTDSIIDSLQPLLKEVNKSEPYVAAFNVSGFYMYEPISGNITAESILNYVAEIEAGNRKAFYASEELPTEEKEPRKLVGKNYQEFISNDDNDDLIFYAGSDESEFSNQTNNLVSYIKENKISGIRVAYISVSNNSVPTGFPKPLTIPHVELFPAKKHNESVSYIGSCSVYSLLHFVSTNGTVKIELNDSIIDAEYEKKSMNNQMIMAAMQTNQKLKDLVEQEVVFFGQKLGLGENYSEIFGNIFETSQTATEDDELASEEDAENKEPGDDHYGYADYDESENVEQEMEKTNKKAKSEKKDKKDKKSHHKNHKHKKQLKEEEEENSSEQEARNEL